MSISKPQTAGIIDNLNAGFSTVNRHPWIILVPLVLNLFLWFGPQISFAPLFSNLAVFFRDLAQNQPDPTIADLYSAQFLALGQRDLRQDIALLNVVPLLTLYTVGAAQLEGIQGFPMVNTLPQMIDPARATLMINDWWGALGVLLAVNVVALGVSAGYLTRMAEAVRGDYNAIVQWLQRSWKTALALFAALACIAIVMIAVGFPFLFFAALLTMASPALGSLMAMLLFIVWFWVQIFTTFTAEAIAISGVGPLHAIRASFMIVRRNFWATLGFLALTFLILIGSGVLWYNVANSIPGIIVAIIGSSYLGCGLAAARLAFYRERLRRWHSITPAIRPLS